MEVISRTVPRLIDLHVHLREGWESISSLTSHSWRGGAGTVLPIGNTVNGILTGADAKFYAKTARREVEIIPSMLVTEQTPLDEIKRAADLGVRDVKMLPLERTTNSHNGIRHFWRMIPIYKECGKQGVRVKQHPENPLMVIDNEDAEYQFLTFIDMALNETDADLFWEHGTDGRCIPAWLEFAKTGRFSVTLTAHHLLSNSSHEYGKAASVCKPPFKREWDRQSLVELVKANHEWVMAGTDSAPHPLEKKYAVGEKCACGDFTAPNALPLYAQALDSLLQTEEGTKVFQRFTSGNAVKKLGLAPQEETVLLMRKPFTILKTYQVGEWTVEPFWAGKTIDWTLVR